MDQPIYSINSAALAKHRSRASKGLASLSRAERRAYGAAVEAAILSAQASALKRAAGPVPNPRCASGTWHNTGAAIDKAIREQHRASLLAYPDKVRRARSPAEWQALYDKAMALKRNGETK